MVSTPKKLFLGDPLLAVPVKLFLEVSGLMPVKLLRGGPCELVPVKLLLFSENEARREERGVEVEDMEERGPERDEGREAGAEAGGVDLGVLVLIDIESLSLVNIFAVDSRLFRLVVGCMVGEV